MNPIAHPITRITAMMYNKFDMIRFFKVDKMMKGLILPCIIPKAEYVSTVFKSYANVLL